MSSTASTTPRSTSGRKRSLPPSSSHTTDARRDRDRDRDRKQDRDRERRHRERDHDRHDRDRRHRDDDGLPWWEQDRRGSTRDVSDRRRGPNHDCDSRRATIDRHNRRDAPSDTHGHGHARDQDERYRHVPSSSSSSHARDRSHTGACSHRQGDHRNGFRREGSYGRAHGQFSPPPASRNDVDFLNYSDTPVSAKPPVDGRSRLESHAPTPIPSTLPSAPEPTSTAQVPTENAPREPEPELELEVAAPVDPEAIIAERRRRRAEILAKYSNANNSTAASEASTPVAERVSTPEVGDSEQRELKRVKLGTASPAPSSDVTSNTIPNTAAGAADEFNLVKDADADAAARAAEQDATAHIEGEEEISAADYNPDEDRKNDDRRRAERVTKPTATKTEDQAGVDLTQGAGNDGDEDDEDDMFAIGTKPSKPVDEDEEDAGKPVFVPVIHREYNADAGQLADNFDDADGYYKLIIGELLDNGRYHVQANLGRGMFSSVVRAKDSESTTGEDVAIKIVRSQESMFKAGLKEAQILRKLQEADPEDKKHLVRLLRTFEHRGHLCLVFENLSMNLREVVKRFGKDVGINLRAVRAYASQMFLALALLKKCDIMHADIKPDNILAICDLGSASDVTENDITPYLVSRFYRAPEIILGMTYDCSLDTWSIACTLYELYTGKILFPGRSNNHMLLLIMELKGKFPHKHLKKGRFTDQHFDPSLNFISVEKDGSSLKTVALSSKAAHDLRSRLMPPSVIKKLKEDEARLLGHFVDLLDKMLSLEPSKRPLPKDLLSHPFIRG
ncbi:BZ3500_MvSof-1268-A1-R1_Chr8-1g09880 [Microbotryum saponariae]|uniref:non-specific serine/threonine protein kinase n=1 Tax=Microbotryum saponariae TaxID=289078 RepID=A0A2X0MUY1_9BASI|nr:BZ3500_MvSof-1268-A1-R1_Chr8-1g09880 [Microbotryum saponariae]SDA08166.1 BZ3501_MvSof-1269-A2-R1_Chr8-1g09603 [Microbotryum saponariae]